MKNNATKEGGKNGTENTVGIASVSENFAKCNAFFMDTLLPLYYILYFYATV